MNEAFVVVDLEATSREPEDAHIVEWAAIVVQPPWFGEGGTTEYGGLVRPPVPIPAETSAVHHIIDEDVTDAETWLEAQNKLGELLVIPGRIAVAHNSEYEHTLLAKRGPLFVGFDVQWLCTYKAALRVWPDCPSHSNECLRYYLGFGTGRRAGQAPHSALHDAKVTSQILEKLLEAGTPIADMLKWTNEPALLPRCPIGEWRGKKWDEVDQGFLTWILWKARDMRPDIKFCAQAEIDRREAARRAPAPVAARDEEEDDVPF